MELKIVNSDAILSVSLDNAGDGTIKLTALSVEYTDREWRLVSFVPVAVRGNEFSLSLPVADRPIPVGEKEVFALWSSKYRQRQHQVRSQAQSVLGQLQGFAPECSIRALGKFVFRTLLVDNRPARYRNPSGFLEHARKWADMLDILVCLNGGAGIDTGIRRSAIREVRQNTGTRYSSDCPEF